MNGTDLLNDEADGGTADGTHGDAEDHYPVPLVSVRLSEIRAFNITDDEDEPVLVVSDGETSVEFACGLTGLSDSAARGARRLADAMREYASAIEASIAESTSSALDSSGGS